MFVGVKHHVALAAFQGHRHDLALEITGLNGALGAVVALHGQGVLVFARDAPFGGNVLGGDAHVDGLERVMQGAHHHVNHLGVAHAGAPAHVQAGIGRTAHGLGTAANGNVGIAEQN